MSDKNLLALCQKSYTELFRYVKLAKSFYKNSFRLTRHLLFVYYMILVIMASSLLHEPCNSDVFSCWFEWYHAFQGMVIEVAYEFSQ